MSEKSSVITDIAYPITLVGFGIGIGVSITHSYYTHGESLLGSDDPEEIVESVVPCEDDPLKFTIDNKRFAVTDTRCRGGASEIVNVMRDPNEATLGPIARAQGAVALRAVCVVRGQEVTANSDGISSDKWIYVTLQTQDGVQFESNYDHGYVSSLDLVADGGLPKCIDKPSESI